MTKGIKHKDIGPQLTRTEFEADDSHELEEGTSFPGSPVEKDRFYRTDEHKWYIYNGTAWKIISGALVEDITGSAQMAETADETGAGFRKISTTTLGNNYTIGTRTLVFSSGSMTVAAGFYHGKAFNSHKLQLIMGGVQVAESSTIGGTIQNYIVVGTKMLEGSQICLVRIHAYEAGNYRAWSETGGSILPGGIGVGAVKL